MNANVRTFFTIILMFGSIAIIATALFFVSTTGRERAKKIQDEIVALEEEKKTFEHQNRELRERVAYLKTDHVHEKEAKKLHYKNKGEHVVIVRHSNTDAPEHMDVEHASADADTDQVSKKHYQIWLDYFF